MKWEKERGREECGKENEGALRRGKGEENEDGEEGEEREENKDICVGRREVGGE